MPNSLKYIKDFVRDSIEKRNWSERDLARRSNLSPPTVNELLGNPDRDVKTQVLEAIAFALGVPPFYLLMSPEERAQWDKLGKTPEEKALQTIIDDPEALLRRLEKVEHDLSVFRQSQPARAEQHDAREAGIQAALELAEKIKAERAAEALPQRKKG